MSFFTNLRAFTLCTHAYNQTPESDFPPAISTKHAPTQRAKQANPYLRICEWPEGD